MDNQNIFYPEIRGIQVKKISLEEFKSTCYINFKLRGTTKETKLSGKGETSFSALKDLTKSIENWSIHFNLKLEKGNKNESRTS